jgi:ABC-type dipeptide/oligopeptide/nickel transport system permease component
MEHPLSFVLPSLTLGSRSLGYLIRLNRTLFLEILSSEFIVTVKAKGGGLRHIAAHAFRNALIPSLTFLAMYFGCYLKGAVLTETVFGWDGIGRYAISGIFKRDYPVVLGTVLLGAVTFILVNFFTDVMYFFLDPKLRRKST